MGGGIRGIVLFMLDWRDFLVFLNYLLSLVNNIKMIKIRFLFFRNL